MQGLDSSAAALMKLTSLIPAGSEEVSMQAAMAFAAEGAQMLASNTAAQQEPLQTGTALVNIAKMYSPVDDTAADTLAFGAPGPLSRPAVANAASSALGAGTAPLSSLGTEASAGGSSRAGLESSVAEDQDESNRDDSGERRPGQSVL